MAKAKVESVKEEALQKDPSDPPVQFVPAPDEVESLKAQLDAAQKALIPFQDENVKLRDEVKHLREGTKDLLQMNSKLAVQLEEKEERLSKLKGPELKGTYVVVDGKREEVLSGPRPFRELVPEWRGRQFNDGCLTIVLGRHG